MNGGRKAALLSEVPLLSAVFALGTNPVAVKYAVGEVPALPFVAFRFTLAGLLLLFILRLLGRWEPLEKGDLLRLSALGIVGVGLNNVLFTFGVGTTTASNTALIYATPPLWGMLLGFLLGTERPRVRGVLGVAVALLGVGVVVYGGLQTDGGGLQGDLLVSGAAVCWGSYTAFSAVLLRRYSPTTVAAWTKSIPSLKTALSVCCAAASRNRSLVVAAAACVAASVEFVARTVLSLVIWASMAVSAALVRSDTCFAVPRA